MESRSQQRKHDDREMRRKETIYARHGRDFFHRNSKKAGKASPTKFTSDSGSAAANARWAKYRENREKGII